MNYATAAARLAKSRNGQDCPLPGKATRLIRRDADTIAVRYHATDVVTFHSDGTVTLQTGGWHTATTKARMNDYSPARIYSHKSAWMLYGDGMPEAEYFDGIRIDANGRVLNVNPNADRDAAARKTVDAAIRKYIKGYAEYVAAHGLQNPDGGDCWHCCGMLPEECGVGHILSHINLGPDAEVYYVPSLLLNAVRHRGGDAAVIWDMMARDAADGRKNWALVASLRSYFRALRSGLITEYSRVMA